MGFGRRQRFINFSVSENWLKMTGLVAHIWLERNGYALFSFKTFTYTISFSAHSLVTPEHTDRCCHLTDGELKLRDGPTEGHISRSGTELGLMS